VRGDLAQDAARRNLQALYETTQVLRGEKKARHPHIP
jgi:uncharacterized protein with HEPN domain